MATSSRPYSAISSFICQACRSRLQTQSRRTFSSSTRNSAEDSIDRLFNGATQNRTRNSPTGQGGVSGARGSRLFNDDFNPSDLAGQSMIPPNASRDFGAAYAPQKAHRLHVFATKHNTHITLVQPPRSASETASLRLAGAKTNAAEQKKVIDTLMSLSAGNIGFKKAGRGSYDAAFQLAAFVMRQIEEKGIGREIEKLEVVLRGFGAGREAVTKAVLGTEGRNLRSCISAVVDATRLKQGGPRSKKPRRLG